MPYIIHTAEILVEHIFCPYPINYFGALFFPLKIVRRSLRWFRGYIYDYALDFFFRWVARSCSCRFCAIVIRRSPKNFDTKNDENNVKNCTYSLYGTFLWLCVHHNAFVHVGTRTAEER